VGERKKKTPVGATVPPPQQEADFFTQLEQTFQRGVVSAEIDLSGLLARRGEEGGGSVKTFWGEAVRVTEGPAGVHERIFKRMKEIASAFEGRFTVHAPMQIEPAGLTSIERARAAALLKDSLKYADKLGAGIITVHPIGTMGYYFVEPFVGQKMPVENPFFLAKDEKELNEMFEKYRVRDSLLREQIKKEWENFVQVLPTYFAEKFGAQAAELVNTFAVRAADLALKKLMDTYREDVGKMINELSTHYHPRVAEVAISRLREAVTPTGVDREKLRKMKAEIERRLKDRRFMSELIKNWIKVDLASLTPITQEGRLPKSREEEEKLRKEAWKMAMSYLPRFGPFKESEKIILENVKDAFSKLLSDPEVKRMLREGKIKIALENLFPAAPERGYMAGYAYFYKPEHMAKLIKELRAIAKAKGIPEDRITLTFDIGHAAASAHITGMKPSEFLEELKKHGVKPEHVHIVGGRGFGHEHIAWGDWLDEVSRMDPTILEKVMELGVVNIEGGAGHHDIEVTLNAMWDQGMPLEAILAIAGGPQPSPDWLRYAGFGDISYWKARAEHYWRSGFTPKAFYSFQYEHVPAPMRTAFGTYTAPGLFGGGYAIGPGRTPMIWSTAQPFLYSTRKKE